jgi:AcrR family transcriptional regulator
MAATQQARADSSGEKRLTSRDRQRLDTRERVFEAALVEFERVGVAETQIEAIVARAHVSVGTFYRYFAGKDAVLFELQQRLVGDVIRSFEERVARATTLQQVLIAFAESVLAPTDERVVSLQREAIALVVRTVWPVPDWRGSPLFGPVTVAFERAQQDGRIRADLQPEKLTQLLSTSIFGFSTGIANASEDRLNDARRLVELFADGLDTRS